MIDTLKLGGRSNKTICNYVHAINRFLNYFHNHDISLLDETDIVQYMKHNYLDKNCSSSTYNLNISAIKYFYSVNFNKEFNNKLLPHAKLTKKIPTTIDKELFDKIFNEEINLKYKCFLLLAYCSGLRAEEVASIRLVDINAKEHKLKILGKGNKERYTVLTDFTIKYLRLYYVDKYFKNNYFKKLYSKNNNTGFLFEGNNQSEHISGSTVTNYFTTIKKKYNLNNNLSFHSLRHSFATNFIIQGGDPFVLKSMLGHCSYNSTSIYVHTGRDFNLFGFNSPTLAS